MGTVVFRIDFVVSAFIRSELPIKKLTEEELLSRFPPVYALLLDVFINTVWAPDVMAERPEIKRVYEMFAMATHPDYRSRGIARKLVAESWEVQYLDLPLKLKRGKTNRKPPTFLYWMFTVRMYFVCVWTKQFGHQT